jgi:hypothetical protein
LYNEILDVSFLNPRYFFEEEARDASRIYWISATLKVDDLARTVWASQIKDYDGSSSGSSEEKVSRKKERERSPFYNKRGIDSP